MRTDYVFNPEVSEAEWLDLEESDLWAVWRSMPHPDGYRRPDRKRLLLVSYLARKVLDQMSDKVFVEAVEAAEQGADELITVKQMWAKREEANDFFDTVKQPNDAAIWAADVAQRLIYSQDETCEKVFHAVWARTEHLSKLSKEETKKILLQQSDDLDKLVRWLIYEVHGNPFRPVAFDPSWRTENTISLASAAYEERLLPSGEIDFGRMLILSDALEEAGCDNEEILNHCREPKVHIRGCWVLDLILEK